VDDDTFSLPAKVYPAAVHLLSLEIYREEILTGFVISAGGLGESLVYFPHLKTDFQTRAASVALADYLDSLAEPDLMAILKSIENILRNNLQNDRIVIPALETVAGLFEENIFSRLEGNYKFVPAGSSLMIVSEQCSFSRRRWGLNLAMS
jgi:hypothetical protein